MPKHWTYSDTPAPESDLCQGDIISRTPEFDKILSEYHQYFLDSKYTFFLVISQTCDLVMRNGKCKAEYITLAAVRELDAIIPDLASRVAGTSIPDIYDSSRRPAVLGLLSRIVNQNEQSLGFFYLHPDSRIEIGTPSVALLRVSIAIRSFHYKTLQVARKGRLSVEFQGKLGWLCGNLFARVATRDWKEQVDGVAKEKQLIESLLEPLDGNGAEYWVSPSWLEEAKRKKVSFDGLDREVALRHLRDLAPPIPLDGALARVRAKAIELLATQEADQIRSEIQASEDLLKLVLERVESFIGEIGNLGDTSHFFATLRGQGRFLNPLLMQVWLAVKKYLSGQRGDPLAELEQSLRAIEFKAIRSSLTPAVKTCLGDDCPEDFAGNIEDVLPERLLTEAAVSGIVGLVDQKRESGFVRLIEQLVTRLENDGEFKKMFKAQPIPVLDYD